MFNKKIALNQYQQLMFKISQFSPYNAVHSVLMVEDSYVLKDAVNTIMRCLAIGIPEFSKDTDFVIYTPPSEEIIIQTRVDSLNEHAQKELNYAFSTKEFPFRFFIITCSEKKYFSITYNHWVGDAFAISRVMSAIFNYISEGAQTPLTTHAPHMHLCFHHIYKNKEFYCRTLSFIRNFVGFSQAFRTPVRDVFDVKSNCTHYFFIADDSKLIVQLCKKYQITVNDFFIIVLAKVFGKWTHDARAHIKNKPFKLKRNRIIIGVISNLRSQSTINLSNIVSVFLGFFYMSFKSPEHHTFKELCVYVGEKTKRFKKQNVAIKQYLLFQLQNKWFDRTKKIRSKFRMFSKNVPIVAGISNMKLTNMAPNLSQYIRFSPTAMVCPIVFNITTIQDHMSLSVSFRESCYTMDEAISIQNACVHEIQQLLYEHILTIG